MEMKYVNGEYRVLMGMSIVVLNSYQHDVVSSSECRSMLIYFQNAKECQCCMGIEECNVWHLLVSRKPASLDKWSLRLATATESTRQKRASTTKPAKKIRRLV